IVRAFGHPTGTALTISASLAQIGEFSFILAGLGISLAILPEQGRDLILAGAMLSILLNPALFALVDRYGPWLEARRPTPVTPGEPTPVTRRTARGRPGAVAALPTTTLNGRAVIIGYGRVGQRVAEAMARAGRPFMVIE